MNIYIKERCIRHGRLMLERDATIRSVAEKTCFSNSTIQLDIADRLKEANYILYLEVRKKLAENKANCSLKGGLKTQEKFINLRQRRKNRAEKQKELDNLISQNKAEYSQLEDNNNEWD